MEFEEKIDILLKENVTKDAFDFWMAVNKKIPGVWDRPSSSSGKYHNKDDGRVPTIAEHTYEMLYACIKIWRLFDISPKTEQADVLLLAITLHDSFKYGENPDLNNHTDYKHDKITGDKIRNIKEVFLRFLSEDSFNLLEESVRYHSGRWSTDADEKKFDFKDYDPITLFVHFLDMMSANNLIHLPEEK